MAFKINSLINGKKIHSKMECYFVIKEKGHNRQTEYRFIKAVGT